MVWDFKHIFGLFKAKVFPIFPAVGFSRSKAVFHSWLNSRFPTLPFRMCFFLSSALSTCKKFRTFYFRMLFISSRTISGQTFRKLTPAKCFLDWNICDNDSFYCLLNVLQMHRRPEKYKDFNQIVMYLNHKGSLHPDSLFFMREHTTHE